MPKQKNAAQKANGATVGYEAQLWQMADALRGSMDAAEYKHVVLGLIFLKYISDAFEEQHAKLRGREGAGRRSGGPGRVPGAEHLLGAAGGALAASEGAGQAGHHRSAHRRRHGRHRARQPLAQGRAAQGVRPPGARQAAARPAHRPGQQYPGWRRREPLQGRPRPCLRVLPLPVRQCRGQEGRRVLHAALRGASCWSRCSNPTRAGFTTPAAALAGMFVQSVKFISAHAQRQRQWRQGEERHQHLRPGVELHHLAAGADEPGDPRHRRPDHPRRHASTTTAIPT